MGYDAKLPFKFHWPKYKVIKHVDYRIQLVAVQQLNFESGPDVCGFYTRKQTSHETHTHMQTGKNYTVCIIL